MYICQIFYFVFWAVGFVVSTMVCGALSMKIKFSRNRAQIKNEEQTSYMALSFAHFLFSYLTSIRIPSQHKKTFSQLFLLKPISFMRNFLPTFSWFSFYHFSIYRNFLTTLYDFPHTKYYMRKFSPNFSLIFLIPDTIRRELSPNFSLIFLILCHLWECVTFSGKRKKGGNDNNKW